MADDGVDLGSVMPAGDLRAPLRVPLFRRMWSASLLSNLGINILGVAAAWAMTQMSAPADMIALVQSAIMLPMALLAIASGAIADMYDRRRVALAALGLSLLGGVALSIAAATGMLTPWALLSLCLVIGCGIALLWPAWGASVSEQVPLRDLPQAVALNSISFNIARSVGPAIGGAIVAVAGAVTAFSTTALLFIPLMIVFLLWRRAQEPSRLPPERLYRAISSGVRYVVHSPPIRTALIRSFALTLTGAPVIALMPLIARDLLHGGAFVYGILLGAFGVGAVVGALNINVIRNRFTDDQALALASVMMGSMIAVLGVSRSLPVTVLALTVIGAGWMASVTLCNISIQLAVPRWVGGRTLAAFQSATAAGMAIGSWGWGHVADPYGIAMTLFASAAAMASTALLARLFPMTPVEAGDREPVELDMPQVALALTGRSGPIVVEVEYRVDTRQARAFYGIMQQIQQVRHRNGAYDWSLARDIGDPELWTERYHCPTWHDYLRLRSRYTPEEKALSDSAHAFHIGPEPVRFHRRLERPFGSVRWREDAPDRGIEVVPVGTALANG